jgi:large subunit ribosomal protein L17
VKVRRGRERLTSCFIKDTLAARRQAAAYVMEDAAVKKLFIELAPRFQGRPGGYTRVQRTQKRRNDNADMAYISYLGATELTPMQRILRNMTSTSTTTTSSTTAASAGAAPPAAS